MSDKLSRALLAILMNIAFAVGLSGCDMIQQKMGIEDSASKEAKAAAEGKAVGGACRQSGRAIEDCYSIYSWLPKSSTYEGWRDMDAYMRDNKMETIEPQLPPVSAPGIKKKAPAAQKALPAPPAEEASATKKTADKP